MEDYFDKKKWAWTLLFKDKKDYPPFWQEKEGKITSFVSADLVGGEKIDYFKINFDGQVVTVKHRGGPDPSIGLIGRAIRVLFEIREEEEKKEIRIFEIEII